MGIFPLVPKLELGNERGTSLTPSLVRRKEYSMSNPFLLFALLIVLASATAHAQEGLWGGKWDDTWPVFLKIEKTDTPGKYSVTYSWVEHPGEGLRTEKSIGKVRGGFI